MSRKNVITKEQLRKFRRAALREQFKKNGVFHAWRRQGQIIPNKKAIQNKKACRKKIEQE